MGVLIDTFSDNLQASLMEASSLLSIGMFERSATTQARLWAQKWEESYLTDLLETVDQIRRNHIRMTKHLTTGRDLGKIGTNQWLSLRGL